jgi:CubicO group peptidase (beta-lactamase class C family)
VYCSAGINLLGGVISTATHAWLPDYFFDRFGAPMQFGAYALPLTPPPLDTAYMAGGGEFLPRDFLKFGQLILDGGLWNGRRIVDSRWIAAVVTPRSGLNAPGDYGYGWHLSTFTVGGTAYPAINAGGNGGQLLFVIPKLDMAVMITAGNYGQYGVWRTFQTEPFERYLIPAATGRTDPHTPG